MKDCERIGQAALDDLSALIEEIRKTDGCEVYPPNGLPTVAGEDHRPPDDVMEFYTLCGGMGLYLTSDYPIYLVPAEDFVSANPVIVGDSCPDDISDWWYLAADDRSGQYITIDLSPERAGRCYDSFWDRHGLVGDCPVIAKSFTELLYRLFHNGGDSWYWLRDDFASYGDAYDDVL